VSRKELGNISRKITHGSMSAITAPASCHISGIKPAFNSILSSGSPYATEQKNAAQMEKFSKFLQAGLGVNLEQIAADIPGTTPWALSIASEVERKNVKHMITA